MARLLCGQLKGEIARLVLGNLKGKKRMQYRTKQGETLDAICFRHYGQASGFVEQVLAANYRLADKGIELPNGTLIELPEIEAASPAQKLVSLFD